MKGLSPREQKLLTEAGKHGSRPSRSTMMIIGTVIGSAAALVMAITNAIYIVVDGYDFKSGLMACWGVFLLGYFGVQFDNFRFRRDACSLIRKLHRMTLRSMKSPYGQPLQPTDSG